MLGPGDTIDVKFPYKTELNESVPVRPDGRISLQMIGDIDAAGLTPAQLSDSINQHYAEVIRDPGATVIVRKFAPQRVYVGGEVLMPGPIELHGPLTCTQALMMSGGSKPTANKKQVLLIRHIGEDAGTVRTLNLDQVLKGKETDVVLAANDVVYVPRTVIAEVGKFVNQYINKIVPRAIAFPLTYELHSAVDFPK